MNANNQREFIEHMKQYRDRYQKIRKGEDGVWELPVKRGDIEPYSLTELSCFQEFNSAYGKEALKRKLPGYCTITQEAHAEIVFKFPMEHIHDIAVLVGARRRVNLSPEQRAQKAQSVKIARAVCLRKRLMGAGGNALKIDELGASGDNGRPDVESGVAA